MIPFPFRRLERLHDELVVFLFSSPLAFGFPILSLWRRTFAVGRLLYYTSVLHDPTLTRVALIPFLTIVGAIGSSATMSETKQRKQKHKEPKLQPAPSGAERLKTVVRRLPPNLPEAVFWQSVEAWVTEDTVSWKSYFPGKFRTKRCVLARRAETTMTTAMQRQQGRRTLARLYRVQEPSASGAVQPRVRRACV